MSFSCELYAVSTAQKMKVIYTEPVHFIIYVQVQLLHENFVCAKYQFSRQDSRFTIECHVMSSSVST